MNKQFGRKSLKNIMSRDNQTFVRFELGIVMFELVQRVTKI